MKTVQTYNCKCKGERGSQSCGNSVLDYNSECSGCVLGRHSHNYYRHLDLVQGCFYVKRNGKTVCAICTSNNENNLRG